MSMTEQPGRIVLLNDLLTLIEGSNNIRGLETLTAIPVSMRNVLQALLNLSGGGIRFDQTS